MTNSRRKGADADRAFRAILSDRDWHVEKTHAGINADDLVVIDDLGKMWSVEIKSRKLINVEAWRKQASENARKRDLPYILAIRIHGSRTWLVERNEGRKRHHSVWTER